MIESNYEFLDCGYNAAIFYDSESSLVRKVFFQKGRTHSEVRAIYNAEIEAYKIAMNSTTLKPFVPGQFKRCENQKIVDGNGLFCSSLFFEDCAYEIEFVRGDFVKVGALGTPEARALIRAFKNEGINHTSDMSVVLDDDEKILKAIDFATQEFEF